MNMLNFYLNKKILFLPFWIKKSIPSWYKTCRKTTIRWNKDTPRSLMDFYFTSKEQKTSTYTERLELKPVYIKKVLNHKGMTYKMIWQARDKNGKHIMDIQANIYHMQGSILTKSKNVEQTLTRLFHLLTNGHLSTLDDEILFLTTAGYQYKEVKI